MAQNWTDEEKRRCVDAANAVLEETGDDAEAIFACIHAAGKGGKTMKHRVFSLKSFKATDEAQGIFEALVAVFNNVDRIGDMIIPGAFTDTLAQWEAKGAPIPVIYSHEWDNLDAHIGEVLEAKEVEEGLYVKGQIDLEEAFAKRVFKKMQRGTLRQFSFAYDVQESAQVDRGEKESPRYINELRKLDLLEVGPCLVGMNPDTQLLDLKGDRRPVMKRGARHSAKDNEMIQAIHDHAVALGAKCAGVEDSGDGGEGEGEAEAEKSGSGLPRSGDGSGKAKGPGRETLAARVALELLEMGDEE